MSTAELLRASVHRVSSAMPDYDPLMRLIGDASIVLIGEASHGTHEFYLVRADITRLLIAEKGFRAVAVEADWPDAHRVDRFVRHRSNDHNAEAALSDFRRFPVWMWRNRVVEQFVAWLHDHNARQEPAEHAGFYGIDLYSLNRSRVEVIRYLDKVDPEAARRARQRYSCFDHYGGDEQEYGYSASLGISESCEGEVVQQLVEIQRRAVEYASRDGARAADAFFSAEQNARLVRNAEGYYRSMFRGRISSWNLRDQHMVETVEALSNHLKQRYGRAKIVVWAHNSHIGDARATDRSIHGEWNVGQLAREKWRDETRLIGFTTYTGTVTAATDWGGPHEIKRIRTALPESWEALFHSLEIPSFLLSLRDDEKLKQQLNGERLERAIGVIYRPETERMSHYFGARLADRFDAVFHLDLTSAIAPLPHAEEEQTEEVPETFPSGV
jgi:erythromycin esterase-like protein